jgi:FtsZ-binding cell division protein ZapB
MPNDIANNMADTIHQLEKELKDLREENKVLTSECDRLIKEKGELLSKVSGGDVLRICQLEEQLEKAKRLLKMAVENFKEINSDILTCKYCKWYSAETDECAYYPEDTPCEQICGWKHEGEALKLIGEDEDENNGKH